MTPKEAYDARPMGTDRGLTAALQAFLTRASADFVARASKIDDSLLEGRFTTDLAWADSEDGNGEKLEALRHMDKPFALVRTPPEGGDAEVYVTDERIARVAAESAREALPAPAWATCGENSDIPIGRDFKPGP